MFSHMDYVDEVMQYFDAVVPNNVCSLPGSSPRINGVVQERRDCSALAMELSLSCTDTSIYGEV